MSILALIIFVFALILVQVKSVPVLEIERINLSTKRDDNTTLFFPMKIENKVPGHKYKNIAINASFVKGEQLILILPIGEEKNCNTVFNFVDNNGKTDIYVNASSSYFEDAFPYNLHNDSEFILWLAVDDRSETIRIRVQKQGDVSRTVDECEYDDIDKIDHIVLEGGLRHVNSVISDFNKNL